MDRADALLRQGDAAEDAGQFALAFQCFSEAAALGDSTGWLRLGLMFDCGIGTPPDKDRAMACYRRGWRRRNTACASNIAVLYRERKNYRSMFRWYARSATEGDGSAWLEMAKCYRVGQGVGRDFGLAVRCLAEVLRSTETCEADVEEAKAMLAELRPAAV